MFMLLELVRVQSADVFESDESRRDLERAARLIVAGEMVAAITHDLRQPLTAIEMNVAAALRLIEARDGTPGPEPSRLMEAAAALRDALAEQQRMREALQVVQDLAAEREPAFAPLNLEKSVHDVVGLVASDAFAKHINIQIQTPEPVAHISADETLVRQALLNLFIRALDSASHALPTGSVIVGVHPAGAEAVETVVTHTGLRAENAVDDRSSLALARSVADAHGASLTVRDDPVLGTSVSIRWPTRTDGGAELGGGASAVS